MISIILINYNRFDLTLNCISSIYEYSKVGTFEIIVVDNNSSLGNSTEIEERFPDVKWIKNDKNMGFAYANNQGIKIANGEFILLLNNDTLFIEDTLSSVVKYYKSLSKPALIGCKLLNSDKSFQISIADFDDLINLFGENFFLYKFFPQNKKLNRFVENFRNLDEPKNVDIIKGAFIFGEKKYFDLLEGFDSRFYFYSEESDLCRRFKSKYGEVVYFPNTKIIHLGGATTDAIPWFSLKNLSIGKIQYFQKHFNNFYFFIALVIHFLGILIRIPIFFLNGTVKFNKHEIRRAWLYFRLLFVYPKNKFK